MDLSIIYPGRVLTPFSVKSDLSSNTSVLELDHLPSLDTSVWLELRPPTNNFGYSKRGITYNS